MNDESTLLSIISKHVTHFLSPKHVCCSHTTGKSALPEIYTQTRGRIRLLTGNA